MLTKSKILVIDDNAVILAARRRALESAGFDTLGAGTGQEALDLALAHKPDLLLLDVHLPDISGIEVCKQIKAEAELQDIFVVLLSAQYTDSESQTAGLESGADGTIALPITSRDLLARVEALLRIQRSEQNLRASEERYRTIANFNYDWEYWAGTDGRFVYVSPACQRVSGYGREEFLQDAGLLLKIIHPEDRELFRQHQEEIESGKVEAGIDFRILTRSGEVRWISHVCTPVYGANGRWLGRRANNHDITERKRAEMALEERNSLLNSVLENTSESIFALDRNYCYIGFNQAHAEVMKALYNVNIEIGGSLAEYQKFAEDWQSAKKNLDRALQGETVLEAGYSGNGDETTRQYFEVLHNPIRMSSGEIIGVSVFAHDITNHKQTEETLERYSARLENEVEERTHELHQAQERLVRQERLAALGQLAGNISHELRNPLGVISNAVYFLKLVQGDANEQVREYLEMIATETRKADKIIQDLLDFSRVKAMDRRAVDIPGLAQGVIQKTQIPENVNVKLIFSADLPRIYADPRHVEQILNNLVTNACQAMPDGGQLAIGAEMTEDQAFLAIAVSDNGAGISPENMENLFEPLFTTKPKGIGLGLVVCQKLAEANEGRIEVQSEVGKGSTFTLYLPVYGVEQERR
jgi:PAS domain S-box-containing protein